MKISCKKVTSLAMSMLLSISGGGICTGKPVALASSDYFESHTLQNSNEEIVTDSAIQIFSLNERSAESEISVGAFTITGEGLVDGADYSFDGTSGTNGVLTILSSKSMTIRNTNPGTPTNDRIEINLPNDSTETANITLAGVNIAANAGPAMKIADNATFNVNINLADNSENTLTTTAINCAGLQKNGDATTGTLTIDGSGILNATGGNNAAGIGGGAVVSASNITISGGTVTATGGSFGAGIGGGYAYVEIASNITISGGTVTATGGYGAAGIGGGFDGSASDITIFGGTVTATGGYGAAGIGGGYAGSASDITISGGTVTATGGEDYGAGIGGGRYASASNNSINGDAVVMATSGSTSKPALEGFNPASSGSIDKGIVFERQTESGDWTGTMYGDEVKIKKDITFPADLTIGEGQTLVIDEDATLTIPEGVTLTLEEGAQLKNKGTIDGDGEITYDGESKLTVLVTYDACGGTVSPASEEKTYRDASGIKTYETLPTPTKTGYTFEGWYTQETGGTPVGEDTEVMPNAHTLYAHWQVAPTPTPTPSPSPSPTPTPGGASAGGFSWNAGGNDDASSSANPTPTPSDQSGMIGTKTLKDIQNQLPEKVKTIGYIKGYDDGTFKPEKNITRAEAAQMIYKLLYNGTRVNYDALQKFSDTNQTEWYSTALAYLADQGLVDGDGGKFYPNRQITRAEMSKILYNALLKYDKDQDKKLTYGTTQFNFTDIPNNWMLEPIKQLATNAMINGYGDGTFKPNNNITRAESVAMISKVFDRSQTYAQKVSFSDVLPSHWAYKCIMNAVNGEE